MNIIIIIKHGPHDMSWFISRAPAHHLGGSDGKADHAACAFEINRSDAQILQVLGFPLEYITVSLSVHTLSLGNKSMRGQAVRRGV